MNKIVKIFLLIILSIFTGSMSIAQVSIQQADSVKLKQKKTKSSVNMEDKNSKDKLNKQQGNDQEKGGTVIKQVKGARPDMSKARGARPPDIVRPSGSRIPKGIGRPGGAIKPGKP